MYYHPIKQDHRETMYNLYDCKNIYLDCDGVLLNSPVAKAHFFNSKYNCNFNGNMYPSQWNYTGSGFDLHTATDTFLASSEFEHIMPMPGAKTAVKYLSDNNYNMHVVTSISSSESVKKKRINNLRSVFGDVFQDVTMFPLGWNNKISFYESMPCGIVVDDSVFNIQDALKCNHKAIFIAIKHNIEWHDYAKNMGIMTAKSLLDCVNRYIIRQR